MQKTSTFEISKKVNTARDNSIARRSNMDRLWMPMGKQKLIVDGEHASDDLD
jgi:hypothetical protein